MAQDTEAQGRLKSAPGGRRGKGPRRRREARTGQPRAATLRVRFCCQQPQQVTSPVTSPVAYPVPWSLRLNHLKPAGVSAFRPLEKEDDRPEMLSGRSGDRESFSYGRRAYCYRNLLLRHSLWDGRSSPRGAAQMIAVAKGHRRWPETGRALCKRQFILGTS